MEMEYFEMQMIRISLIDKKEITQCGFRWKAYYSFKTFTRNYYNYDTFEMEILQMCTEYF